MFIEEIKMDEFNHAKKRFAKYVVNYDTNIGAIKLKIVHSYEVVNNMQYLCQKLNLNQEDSQIALIIALLHDIGRFEQYRIYQSFEDYRTIDHAAFSSKLLFEQGLIKEFITTRKYDHLIKVAIEQHNKYQVTDNFNERELLFIYLIRDSDKLDNFRVKETESFETLLNVSKEQLELEKISDVVYEQYLNCQLIYSPSRQTNLDKWLSYIAFIFDLHFDVSKKYIKENNYINRLFNRITPVDELTAKKYQELKQLSLKYIEE